MGVLVRTRLLGIIGVTAAVASALMLVVLLKQAFFPSRLGLILVWLLPISFGMHVFEEFGFPGGYGEWSRTYRPQTAASMTPAHFYRINLIGGAATIGVALGAFDYAGGYSFFGIRAWLAVLAWIAFNAVVHIRGAFESRRYCPGVVTSIALYLPLTVLGVAYFLRTGAVGVLSLIVVVAWGIAAYALVVRALRQRALVEKSPRSSDSTGQGQ